MAYKIHFEDITNVQREVSTTITGWAEALASIESAMSQFMSDSALQGQALNGMKSYLAEVHYPIILVLGTLMQDYSASLLLYKDGYYNIDDASKAKLPEQNLTTLKSDLEGSRNNLQNQLDLLSTEKAKINDILTYRGMSHTTTIMKYNALINDLNRLHQSIAQYESQHTMQDLVPFKELLASTKRLLASYGSQSRNVGSYQPGSIGQLQQMQEVAAAYSNAVNHLSNRTDRIKTAQERDAVRWEAIAAEERRNQGVLNFVVGALTVVGGVVAIVATAGAATPLVVAAGATLGTGTALYGYSNMIEAEQDIIYGSLGDSKSFAVNPIRDTIFLGNNQLYHQTGQIFSIGSSIIAPIGQTGSVVKGLAQFGGGALGAWGGGELGYHGAKLLGASDSQANAAKFLTSMAGASAGSSLAGKFSLNRPSKEVPKVVSRSDNNFYSQSNHKGAPKAYIDGDGNLVPANPNGTGSVVSHVRGGNSSESPYISTTDLTVSNSTKHYGNQQISIKTRKLQLDIDAGRMSDVEIITHDELVSQFTNRVQQAQVRYTNNPTPKNLLALDRANLDLQNVIRDGEVLIKGIVPKKYINHK